MKHIVITKSTPQDIATMQSYAGTEIIKEDTDFAVFYWTDASNDDIDAITGNNGVQSVALVGMMMLNLPLEL
jgi:hypothetical protein